MCPWIFVLWWKHLTLSRRVEVHHKNIPFIRRRYVAAINLNQSLYVEKCGSSRVRRIKVISSKIRRHCDVKLYIALRRNFDVIFRNTFDVTLHNLRRRCDLISIKILRRRDVKFYVAAMSSCNVIWI